MIKKKTKLGISEQKKEYGSCENMGKYNRLHFLSVLNCLTDETKIITLSNVVFNICRENIYDT